MTKFLYNKLVRSFIIDDIEKVGGIAHFEQLSDDEYLQELKNKLLEECKEVIEENNIEKLSEELADVIEVIFCIAEVRGINLQELENIRINKKKNKGSFSQKKKVISVDIPENNNKFSNWLAYLRANPKKYPEIVE